MTKPQLRLIQGGVLEKEKSPRTFISASVTDTRLMGATALYLHWEIKDSPDADTLHQFFYFDDEEFGLETYRSVWGDDEEELLELEQTLMGGLGGKKNDLTQRQALFLVNQYASFNTGHNIPLPGPVEEYRSYLDPSIKLTPEEATSLQEKMCTPMKSDYQVINYFLMRCFGKDAEGAGYLAEPGISPSGVFPGFPISTLCKNTIDQGDGGIYINESLVEFDKKYAIVISKILVREFRVTHASMVSTMNVSPAEAAMMLSRPEFISLYDIMVDPEEFDEKSWELSMNAMVTSHENGRLFLLFHHNNNHVNRRVFRLSDDVAGLYFVTDFGQLILSASTLKGIRAMEERILKSPLGHLLLPGEKYEFKEPVLYEFIQSDFEDFEEYLYYLNPEEDDPTEDPE